MSKRFTELEQDLRELRKQFLPEMFDRLGQYKDGKRVQAHTRAFVVLSHAEFETFLEEWAKDLARAAERVWIKHNRITTPLAFLLSWYEERLNLSSGGPSARDSHQRLADIISKLFPAFYNQIKKNHGVREANVLRLLGPIGVPGSAFGSTLLPNLDGLGASRGNHAHRASRAVLTPLDPETESKKITVILHDLKVLDDWLGRYKQRIR